MDLREYQQAFEQVRAEFEKTIASFGLPFEEKETELRTARKKCCNDANAAFGDATDSKLCHCENNAASLWMQWISSACLACRTGEETSTFFVSLKCTRNCYFCFNPNQEDYEYFQRNTRDIAEELRRAHAAGAHFRHLAITGGEPCLHKQEVLDFIETAKEFYPGVHIRLYTCGDLLDDAFLGELHEAGLDEIRFSVKPLEEGDQEPLFERMAAAVKIIPDVMVEMPVIPGSLEEMKNLLLRLNALGLRGINLLEFCFPLCNAEAFLERGFALRKNPYEILYDYWYAGGLPVAGSEEECLELLRFTSERKLDLGVHYCSLDNKNSGQVFQQNKGFLIDKKFASDHPWLSFDEQDYFLKCAKVFGDDVASVKTWLDGRGVPGYELDEEAPQLSFPLALLDELQAEFSGIEIGISYFIVEVREEGPYLRELTVVESSREA